MTKIGGLPEGIKDRCRAVVKMLILLAKCLNYTDYGAIQFYIMDSQREFLLKKAGSWEMEPYFITISKNRSDVVKYNDSFIPRTAKGHIMILYHTPIF